MARLSSHDGRRVFLKDVGVRVVAAVPLALTWRQSHASKARKNDFFFQEKPKDGKRCADCKLFTQDGSTPGLGTCSVVEGVINADGWCMAFTRK